GERLDPPGDTDRRRRAGDEEQVAALAIGEQPQPALEPRRVGGPVRCRQLDARVQLENQPFDVVHGQIVLRATCYVLRGTCAHGTWHVARGTWVCFYLRISPRLSCR